MPLTTMRAGIAAKAYGWTNQTAGGAATFTGLGYIASYNARSYGITVDASNNVIFSGNVGSSSGDLALIGNIASTGTSLNWQRQLTDVFSSHAGRYNKVAFDGTNFYACGYGNNTSASVNAILVKYNSGGAVQWQRYLYDTLAAGSQNDRATGVCFDSSGNVYLSGNYWNASSGTNAFLAKYDGSGTLSFKVKLADANTASNQQTSFNHAASDGTSIGAVGYSATAGGTSVIGLVTKYNTSGTLQWQRFITDAYTAGPSTQMRGTAIDSSGNVYATGYGQNASNQQVAFLAKYNSSGTIQWQRTITDPNATPSSLLQGITTDSSGNVYVAGYGRKSGSTITDGFIAKYDSSGTIQWQKTLTGSTNLTQLHSIAMETGGANIIVSGLYSDASGLYDAFVLRYPTNGSKTGTFTISGSNTINIASSSWTSATSTWTDAAGTATAGTATDLNAGTLSWTDAAGSITYAGVAI